MGRFFVTRPVFAIVVAVVTTIVGLLAYFELPVEARDGSVLWTGACLGVVLNRKGWCIFKGDTRIRAIKERCMCLFYIVR